MGRAGAARAPPRVAALLSDLAEVSSLSARGPRLKAVVAALRAEAEANGWAAARAGAAMETEEEDSRESRRSRATPGVTRVSRRARFVDSAPGLAPTLDPSALKLPPTWPLPSATRPEPLLPQPPAEGLRRRLTEGARSGSGSLEGATSLSSAFPEGTDRFDAHGRPLSRRR